MTDSDDLEAQAGPGGSRRITFSLFFGPRWGTKTHMPPRTSEPAPATSEPAPELKNLPDYSPKKAPEWSPTYYFRHYFSMTLGSVFLVFFIVLASFLSCWGSH